MDANRRRARAGTTSRAAILAACAALALVARRGAAADPTCLLVSADFDRAQSSSAACLSCHDGSCASSISGDRSHPVDRPYASGWLRGKLSLRSIPARELVLSAGVVTCATCHDGRSGLPHRTAMPGSRICQGCHDR